MPKKPVCVKWTGNKQFIGTDSGQHSIVISSHDEANHTGMKPSDLLLVSLASCSGYDVVDILHKKRLSLDSFEVELTSVQDPDPPWIFREIHLAYTIQGEGLTENVVNQAINLSLEKYCSVAATLSGIARITHSLQIGA